MKNIMMSILLMAVLTMFCGQAYAEKREPPSIPRVTIDQLAQMPEHERNKILNAQKLLMQAQQDMLTSEKLSIEDGVEFIDGLNMAGLADTAGKLADAILIFCDKLGVGVEKLITSKFGIVAIVCLAYYIGIFGSIIGTTSVIIFLIFLVWLMIGLNTTKKVVLKTTMFDEKGAILSIKTKETLQPRFSAIFSRLDGTSSDFDELTTKYRILGTIISTVLIVIFISSALL